MSGSEDWMAALAAEYIGATLGVTPQLWDTCGKQGAYDLRYEHDGRSVAVEVKSVVHQDLRKMEAAIEQAGYVPAGELAQLWVVYLRAGAKIRLARAQLPALLARFEALGWVRLPSKSALRNAGLAEQTDSIGLLAAHSQAATAAHPPGFALQPEQVWTWEQHTPNLPTFVSDVLADEDSAPMRTLRRQLAGAVDVDERHAFLFVGWEQPASWPLLTPSGGLPTERPQLPAPVDGVWLATFSSDTRVVAWLPGPGWIEGCRPDDQA